MLLLLAAAALALQLPADTAPRKLPKDSSICISIGGDACGSRKAKRIPVTPQHLATAFRDTAARALLLRARAARMQQDSAIVSYDASTYMRISAGMKVGRVGRDRLIFRSENATHVRWHRDRGAHVEVTGARHVFPGMSDDDESGDDVDDMSMLPYFPGQESLWIGEGMAKADVNENELVHPLAEGAEAYYTYASGDAASFRLPDGHVVRLRELKVRPRVVRWNVVVGSLWFDADRGQLVRAAYRLAEPIDIMADVIEEDDDGDEIPRAVKAIITPLRGQVTAMAVEYGLHQGRFWLPRLQSAEGEAQASFMRIPFRLEQSVRYASVNAAALDSLPAVELPPRLREEAAIAELPEEERRRWRDSTRALRREAAKARADSVRQGLVKNVAACDTGTVRTTWQLRNDSRVPMMVTIPCDAAALAASPDLPASIYGGTEEIFDATAREELIRQALALGAQPEFGPRPPVVEYGLQFVRFNRIEGLSVGARATQQLGAGYVADATLRFGIADREPNAELGLARTNLTRTIRLGAYNRLVSAGDWGNPLSFGSSLSALLWGRDEGFYYRASGVDLVGTREQGAVLTWRLFAEQQRTAAVDNDFSLAKALRDAAFGPNLVADRGTWAGGSLRLARTFGLDPRAARALTDVRIEGASGSPDSGGTARFGRAAADLTLSRALGPTASRAPVGALTLSAGSTVGDVPTQRLWYLGGNQTVRGQAPGTAVGDAYWFGRAEVGEEFSVVRVSLFGDAGWAGPRDAFSSTRAISGAGIGFGILDGLLRLDVARGIHPSKDVRVDLMLEARF